MASSSESITCGIGKAGKEGFKEKIKTFFHISKEEEFCGDGSYHNPLPRRSLGAISTYEKAIRDLESKTDTPVRVKALKSLETVVSSRRLDQSLIASIWSSMEDMFFGSGNYSASDISPDSSHRAAIKFSVILINGQFDQLDALRPRIFEDIEIAYDSLNSLTVPESAESMKGELFTCLKALTKDGSCVSGFGEKVSCFLLRWATDLLSSEGSGNAVDVVEFLSLVQLVIRDNASYWDEDQMCELISLLCVRACHTKIQAEIEQCLSIGATVLCYSLLPRSMLLMVMTSLCKLVNREALCAQCWRLARNIFGSHLGNGAIHTLSNLLQASEAYPDVTVLRGAVYFIGMGLWGSQRVDTLRHRPAAVLPSFQCALAAGSLIVTFEILLSLQRLVQKYGRDLQLVTWHVLLKLLENTVYALEDSVPGDEERQWQRLLHEILTVIEDLYETNSFGGSVEQLFSIVELCARQRPEASILRLLSYRSQAINPLKAGWLGELNKLLYTYHCEEVRCSIRIKSLLILRNVYTEQKHLYGREIVETVVLPLLGKVAQERDSEVLDVSINFLCDVAKHWYDAESLSFVLESSVSRRTADLFYDVVSLVESFVNVKLKGMDIGKLNPEMASVSESMHQYFQNVEKAVCGLLEILEAKWCSWPPTHCFYLLNLLAEHLKLHYEKGIVGYLGGSVRETIFQCLLQLRADPASHRLGIGFRNTDTTSAEVLLSPYAVCCVKSAENWNSSTDEKYKFLEEEEGNDLFSWNALAEAVTLCLRKELWWPALKTFFRYLPGLLQNRILVLSAPESVREICVALVQLVGDPRRAGILVNAPENFSMSELNDIACSSLAPFVAYKNELGIDLQKKLVMGIQGCLVSDRSTAAVIATIGCTLELPEAVAPMTRDLIRRMSELPSSPRIVIPMMELLSALLHIRSSYQFFSERHYEHLMDILVPCTNPEKFTTFIVAMGYNLLCSWFINTPMVHRQNLAKYITTNMDLFSKKTSFAQKLNEQQLSDKALGHLMRGTLNEFLNHYAFTDTPPQNGQNRVIQALIEKQGVSKSWIVEDRIFTVKTAVSAEGSEFLCSKCQAYLRRERPSGVRFPQRQKSESLTSADRRNDFSNARRRHASAVQKNVTQVPVSLMTSMDDSCICTSPQIDRTYVDREVRFDGLHQDEAEVQGLPICACWCQGYAIVDIRHCFGRTSWLVKISEGQLDSGNTEILRQALIRLGERIADENRMGVPSRKKKTVRDMPRNFSDTVLVMNIDSELMSKGPEWDRAEAALSRNSSISMKSGRSLLELSDEQDNAFGDVTFNLAESSTLPIQQPDSDNNVGTCHTPTSTDSSAYFSVRSSHPSNKSHEGRSLANALRIDPSWIFTQLCGVERGLRRSIAPLPEKSSQLVRSLRLLDMLRPEETHKIGVVYAAPRQQREDEMLGNAYGSERYARFLEGLGELLSLKDCDQERVFVGGLDTDGSDGRFTYHWQDQVTQVVFHVSSLMPNSEKDPSFNKKKMHIGNDYVAICYNDTGREYKVGTISGELSYVVIVVEPEDSETLSIRLIAKDEISRWLTMKNVIISDEEAPLLCRQMAMRADLSAKIWYAQQNNPEHPYVSSSLERLKEIQKIRDKFQFHIA